MLRIRTVAYTAARMQAPDVSFAPNHDANAWRSGTVLEVQSGGCFVGANTLYPPGTKLTLLLAVPGERLPVRLSGEVAWARAGEPSGMFVTTRYFEDASASSFFTNRSSTLRSAAASSSKRTP